MKVLYKQICYLGDTILYFMFSLKPPFEGGSIIILSNIGDSKAWIPVQIIFHFNNGFIEILLTIEVCPFKIYS